MKTKQSYIILGWCDTVAKCIDPGQPDIGISPKFEYIPNPCTCVWLRSAKPADIAKANDYATTENKTREPDRQIQVFVYADENNPIDRARAELLQ